MAKLFEIPEDMKKEDIYAFTYAEGGAMGCPGRVNLMMRRDGTPRVYELETMYVPTLFDQVMELLPELKDFFENRHLDEAWHAVYLGCGNHLFVRTVLYQKLKKKYDTMLESDIYGECMYDVMNILDTCNVTKPFTVVEAIQGDITRMKYCEAIVNAANKSLLGGGGVDGAIHRAAGKKLLVECRILHGCETGEAKMTGAYHLPCKYVIHTAGPRWCGGTKDEAKLLAECYRNSLEVARKNGIRTIAFPSISTGIYGYPLEPATKIAVNTVRDYVNEYPDSFDMISFVLFDAHTREVYQNVINQRTKTHPMEVKTVEELVKEVNEAVENCDRREMTEEEIIEDDAEYGYFQQEGADW